MLLVARAVTMSALARGESRGAHQREDLPGMLPQWRLNQVARLDSNGLVLTPVPAVTQAAATRNPLVAIPSLLIGLASEGLGSL